MKKIFVFLVTTLSFAQLFAFQIFVPPPGNSARLLVQLQNQRQFFITQGGTADPYLMQQCSSLYLTAQYALGINSTPVGSMPSWQEENLFRISTLRDNLERTPVLAPAQFAQVAHALANVDRLISNPVVQPPPPPPPPPYYSALCVDDDPAVREQTVAQLTGFAFEYLGYPNALAARNEYALVWITRHACSVAQTDIRDGQLIYRAALNLVGLNLSPFEASLYTRSSLPNRCYSDVDYPTVAQQIFESAPTTPSQKMYYTRSEMDRIYFSCSSL